MPPTITQPICWRDSAPAPVREASGTAPSTIAPVVIRIGRRRSTAASSTASIVAHALRLDLVGELHDQDAVLGDEAHQRDQADLAVDVERAARRATARAARRSSTSGTVSMMMNGSTKLSNCAASTRKMKASASTRTK